MTNVITRLSGKHSLENGECGVHSSPQSIKRRKVNAIRQFPAKCGSIAQRVRGRHDAGENPTKNLKAGSSKLPIKLSVESFPDKLKSEVVKKLLESHGEALPENVEMGSLSVQGEVEVNSLAKNNAMPNCSSIAHRVRERHNGGQSLLVTSPEKFEGGSSKLPIELSAASLPNKLKSEVVKKSLESHGEALLKDVEMGSLSVQSEVEVNSRDNNNAIHDCGSIAQRVRERNNPGEYQVVTAPETLKAGSSELPVEPSVALPDELKSKPLEWYGKAPSENVEMDSPNDQGEINLNSLANNNATPMQIDIHCNSETSSRIHLRPRKYPTPKIRKGVTIFRDFPRGCGRRNLDLSSKHDAFPSGKSSKEDQRTSETGNEQITGGFCDDGRNILQDIKVVEAETRKGTDIEKAQLLEQACQFNHEAGIDSISITSTPQSNEDGAKRWVEERIGSDAEEYIKYELSNVNTGVVMPSVMFEGSDISHSDIGIVSGIQPGVEVSDVAVTSSTDGYDDQRYELMGTNGSNYLRLKDDDVNSFVPQNAVSDDRWKSNDTHSAIESNDLTACSLNAQEALSRDKVQEVLDLFEKMLLEVRLREKQLDRKSVGKKMLSHVYVEVAMQLKSQGKWIHMNERFLGAVPGIEVGDQFHYRAELVVVGLHNQFVAGIDYMEKDGKKIATSIVSSGRYSTDKEFEDVLIYSGEGGNQALTDHSSKGQTHGRDQTLTKGNLALKNSMDAGTPVRVIRGRRCWKAKETMFTYDGLYIVSNCWKQTVQNGNQVYMFQLNKIQGQPKLYLDKVRSVGRSKSRRGCLTLIDDISYGKEKIPIRVVNNIDNDKPPTFTYITNMVYPQLQESATITNGCHCVDGCSDDVQCSCVVRNEGVVPFNENGAIVRAKPIVYECGPSCRCPPSCNNRVTQHGLKFQLEVFKTKMRGWGVRSRNFIPSGSFICEYVGELLNDIQAEERIGFDEYLFDIGGEDGFAIDAAQFGNIGRFVNHSCSPNLYAQDVLFDHDDKMMPHVMLFATRNIPPLQELTYDYNYKIDHVYDSNGNVKIKTCRCGSRNCTGRMY